MYCVYCGAPLPEGGKFCPHCGRTAEEADGLAILVERARSGDQGAMAALYEQTCGKVFATVRSMIKNEEDAWDILQDAYIKAFTHLDSFAGEEKFLPWVRQIAANTARDWLKKRRPTLFSDLGGSEEKELPPEERLVEERESALPEQVLDREETARLLREIIDSLPEDQRAVIGMFYYQEMPVKDIAAALGASESAVKSRLLYGRRKIEAKVRELEKSGTKLYGLAPIPFLLWLLRGREVYAAQIPGRVLEGALAGAAQTAGAAAGASASAGGAAVSSAAGGGAASTGTAAAVGGLGAVKIGLLVLTGVALAWAMRRTPLSGDRTGTPTESLWRARGPRTAGLSSWMRRTPLPERFWIPDPFPSALGRPGALWFHRVRIETPPCNGERRWGIMATDCLLAGSGKERK